MYKRIIRSEKTESWLILILLSFIWGSSFVLIKEGLTSFSPLQATTIRISIAFIFMLPFALKNFKEIPKEKYKFIIITGVVGNFIPAFLFSFAQTELESSITGILNALTPMFTLIFAFFFFGFKIKKYQTVGLMIGFTGTLALSFVNYSGKFGNINLYALPVVAATICYAINVIIISIHLKEIRSVVITSLALAAIGPISLIYLFSTDFIQIMTNDPSALKSFLALLMLGIFGTAIGLFLYTNLIHTTSIFFAGTVTYLVPIVAIGWGLLLGEKIFFLHFAGLFLILTGIYFVNKSENKTLT